MKAYQTELSPNNKQTTVLRQHVGAARWAYNWGLSRVKAAIREGRKWPTAIDLHKELNTLKGTPELAWGYEVSKCAFQEALRNLQAALDNWRSSKKGNRQGKKVGFPKFKSKKKGLGSCRFTGSIKVFNNCIQLPRIGVIRLKERGYIPTDKRVTQATIRERAGRWFVSVLVAEPEAEPKSTTGEVMGVDVGIKTLATCSNGVSFANPKALAARIKQLRRWQRKLSRRVKGSQNRTKAREHVAKIHKQIADVRLDSHNQAARAIVNQRPAVIVLEDLNVKGMCQNRRLARVLADAAIGQFGRILTYMAEDAGITVLKAGRFFASSKTCSGCGWKNDHLTLSDRTFVCQSCDIVIDRDLNAAINLKHTVSFTGINACGDSVRPGFPGSGRRSRNLVSNIPNGIFV